MTQSIQQCSEGLLLIAYSETLHEQGRFCELCAFLALYGSLTHATLCDIHRVTMPSDSLQHLSLISKSTVATKFHPQFHHELTASLHIFPCSASQHTVDIHIYV